jgi:hypothetical protein
MHSTNPDDWHEAERLEEGRIKFPILARIEFHDYGALTTRDKRVVKAEGLVTGEPVFGSELDLLYVPVLCGQEASEQPKRLLVAESNIFDVTLPSEWFGEVDEEPERDG